MWANQIELLKGSLQVKGLCCTSRVAGERAVLHVTGGEQGAVCGLAYQFLVHVCVRYVCKSGFTRTPPLKGFIQMSNPWLELLTCATRHP